MQDNYYRELCVKGAELGVDDFDDKTGEPKPKEGESALDTALRAAGLVSGVKPAACMPKKTLPLLSEKNAAGQISWKANDLTSFEKNPNLAFAWYLNASSPRKPDPAKPGTQADTMHTDNAQYSVLYKNSNDDTRKLYSLANYCKEIIKPAFTLKTNPDAPDAAKVKEDIINLAYYWRARQENCYFQYILQRNGFKIFEPGAGAFSTLVETDEDAKKVAVSYCQPLMSGGDAVKVHRGEMKLSDAKPVPLMRSSDPLVNEDEYPLGDVLNNALAKVNSGAASAMKPYFTVSGALSATIAEQSLPCAQDTTLAYTGGQCTAPPALPAPPTAGACASRSVFSIPGNFTYQAPPNKGTASCLPVERINDPTNPFSPLGEPAFRAKITLPPDGDASVARPESFTVSTADGEKTNHWDGTDRLYSYATSRLVKYTDPATGQCATTRGYTDFTVLDDKNKQKYPEVACAVLPTDIYTFRQPFFENGIMQLINYNLNIYVSWLEAQPGTAFKERYQDGKGNFIPPCSTSVSMGTDPRTCPVGSGVQYSIEQLCGKAAGPMAMANQVKIRNYFPAGYGTAVAPVTADINTGSGTVVVPARHNLTSYGFGGNSVSLSVFPPAVSFPPEKPADYPAYKKAANDAFRGMMVSANLAPSLGDQQYLATIPVTFQLRYWLRDRRVYDPDTGDLWGVHYPPPRWWDTGAAAGNKLRGAHDFQNVNFVNDYIVGVGAEWGGFAAGGGDPYFRGIAQNGSGFRLNNGTLPAAPNGAGGWLGLLGEQAMAMRHQGLACLPRYEKMFKFMDADNYAYSALGALYNTLTGKHWTWPYPWAGYAFGMESYFEGDAAGVSPGGNTIWADVSSLRRRDMEPRLNGQGAQAEAIFKATDRNPGLFWSIRSGDIISFLVGGLPRTYVVKESSDLVLSENPRREVHYLLVRGWNASKFLTSTGIGDQLGTGQWQYLYVMPHNLGAGEKAEYDKRLRIHPQLKPAFEELKKYPYAAVNADGYPTCDDPNYMHCFLEPEHLQTLFSFRASNIPDYGNKGDMYDAFRCDTNGMLPELKATYDMNPGNYDLVPWGTLPADKENIYRQNVGKAGRASKDGTGPKLWLHDDRSEAPINKIAYCVNKGFIPPYQWMKEGGTGFSAGSGTGTITPVVCDPGAWESCSTASGESPAYPKGASAPAPAPAPAPSTGTGGGSVFIITP